MNKVIIIADIHGCLEELKELVNKAGWNKSQGDRLILAGDLMDRGPNSVGVVKWARENGAELVRGNHDDRYVKLHVKMKWHAQNPGNSKPAWLRNYPDRIMIYRGLSQEDHDFLKDAPVRIWLPEHQTVVVHAGFHPDYSLEDQEDNSMMHVRFLYDYKNHHIPAKLDRDNDYAQPLGSYFWADFYDEPWNVVYGHHVWDMQNVKIHETPKGFKCWGIDTGCCFGGTLSSLILERNQEPKIVQVKSRQPPKVGHVK